MASRCPDCGSRELRFSHRRNVGETLRGLFGYYPVRCGGCRRRFEANVWSSKLLRYAHCPRCLRTDLSRWNLEHYIVPFWTKFKLSLGAQPYRCETCRCNFASFLPRGERFSWRKHKERSAAIAAAERGRKTTSSPSIDPAENVETVQQ